MRAVSPVFPSRPELQESELQIARDQPEYETLPALAVGGGWIVSRWEFAEGERAGFEAGATINLFVLHGPGGQARDHRLACREPEPRPPMLLEPWPELAQGDPRFTVFPWRPFEDERAAVLEGGSVWLFQQTAGQAIQPVALLVEGASCDSERKGEQ